MSDQNTELFRKALYLACDFITDGDEEQSLRLFSLFLEQGASDFRAMSIQEMSGTFGIVVPHQTDLLS